MEREPAPAFTVSPSAAARIAELLASAPGMDHMRVAVLSGGCNGFQYRFGLGSGTEEGDAVVRAGEATVAVDPSSLEFLGGAELEYRDELMGAYFAVRNPNARSSCGCGTSFSPD